MMQENVGRVRRERAGLMPHHGVEAKQPLAGVGLKPAVEDTAGRLLKKVEQRPPLGRAEPS